MKSLSAFQRWAPVVLVMGIIYLVSDMRMTSPLFHNAQKFHGDWLAHGVEYGFLGYLLCRAVADPMRVWRPFLWTVSAFGIGLLYAMSDEYHQRFVPTRTSDPRDLIADTVGLWVGIRICLKFMKDARCQK